VLISGELVLVCTSSNYFVGESHNPFGVNNKLLLVIQDFISCSFFPYNCCVFMHVTIAMNIVFGPGFLCIATRFIFLNHQK
jgi:hypothetical protein